MLIVRRPGKSSESEREADRYRPDWLLPYMPANPDLRDPVMLSATLLICSLVGFVAVFLINKWLAVAVAALSSAHFYLHYLFRILDRHNPHKRSRGDGE